MYEYYTESEKELFRHSNLKAEKRLCLLAEVYISGTKIRWGINKKNCSIKKLVENIAVTDYKSIFAKLSSLMEQYVEGILENKNVNIENIVSESEKLFGGLHPFFTEDFQNDYKWYPINYAKSYMEDEMLYSLVRKFDNNITEEILGKYSSPMTAFMYSIEGEDLQIVLNQQKKKSEYLKLETQSPYERLCYFFNHFKTYLYLLANVDYKNPYSSLYMGFLKSFKEYCPEKLANILHGTTPSVLISVNLIEMIEYDVANNKLDSAVEEITLWKDGLVQRLCFNYNIYCFEQLLYLYLKFIFENKVKVRICPCCKRVFLPHHKEVYCSYSPASPDAKPCNANEKYQQSLNDCYKHIRKKITKRFDARIQNRKISSTLSYTIIGKYIWQQEADRVISEYKQKYGDSLVVSEPDPLVDAILELYNANTDDIQAQTLTHLEKDLEKIYKTIIDLIKKKPEMLSEWFEKLPNSKAKENVTKKIEQL